MSPAVVMERVYDALKERLMRAELPPGSRLDPVRLAFELNASATPVRDALHRLVGERMVRYWPQDGFHAPLFSEVALRELYAWHHELVLLALRSQPAIPKGALAPPHGQFRVAPEAEAAMTLFATIAGHAGNLELRQALIGVNERLYMARLAEGEALGDLSGEIAHIAALLTGNARAELRRALSIYHKRRMRAVPRTIAIMRARAGAEP